MAEIRTEYVGKAYAGIAKINPRWWEVFPEEEIHKHLFPLVLDIDLRQNYRRRKNNIFARMYSNLDPSIYDAGFTARTPLNTQTIPPSIQTRPTINVIKSCVDTAAAMIAKSKPRPLFITNGGVWSQQQRAKKLTKFMDGLFKEIKIYAHKQKSFVDGEVYGTGAIKFIKDDKNKKVRVENVMIDEIIVDDYDGMYGNPEQMFHLKYVSKDVLLAKFPEFAFQINEAKSPFVNATSQLSSNMIQVCEGWKRASGKVESDGFHAIVIETATLFAEQYDKNYFPFVFDRWTPKLTGFFGMGIAEEIAGIQLEINSLLNLIERSQHIACVPRVWIEENSNVNSKAINNLVGSIGKYRGTPPIFQSAPGLSPEIYSHLMYLNQKAFETVGISQMNAGGTKPAGLNSGAAIREFQDTQGGRFQLIADRYDQSFLEASTIVMDMMDDIGNVKVKVSSGKFAEDLNWRDVRMDSEDYILDVYPTSALPTHPGARKQEVQEWVQAGFIDIETAKSLMQFPDTEQYMNVANSPVQITMMMIEKMIDDGEYQSPEPYMNLQYTLQYAQGAYLFYRTQAVPEERLELLRNFIDATKEMLSSQAAPMLPISPEGVPLANPEAPPVSDLIPNVPTA